MALSLQPNEESNDREMYQEIRERTGRVMAGLEQAFQVEGIRLDGSQGLKFEDVHGWLLLQIAKTTGWLDEEREPVEPRGLDLLFNLPDTPALRAVVHRLQAHQSRLPLWPRNCQECGESFRPRNRKGRRCQACRRAL